MKIKLSLLLIFVLILSTFSVVSADGQIAKQIKIGRFQVSHDLDPVVSNCINNSELWMFSLYLEGLVKGSNDGTSIEPALAESWDISEDELVYTFHLKPGVKFSDGTPVTGEDWEWSLLRSRDAGAPFSFVAEAIEDVTSPDENTLIIKLKETWGAILADLAMFNLPVQNKAYFESMGQEAYSKKPMGTGPYMLKEWEIGEYVLFTKNPYYHIEGLPKTEEIKFIVVLDDNTRLLQLATGQLDIATYVPFSKLQEVDSNPKLTAMGVPSTFTYNIFLNHTRKPYDSQKVREALDYGTDKQALVNFILFGNGEVATSFRPPSSLFYNSSLKDRGYDVEKAKALLAEAGYPNGFDAEILLRSGDVVFEQISVLIKEQWSKIGINVSIHALESGVGKAEYRAFNYDVIVGPWTDDMNDPSAQCEYYFIPENMDCASTGWTSTERAIELTEKGKRETDLEKREQIYLELQQILYDEVPFIPVFHVPFLVAMSNDIEGFVQNPLGTYRFEELVKNLK